VEEGVIEVSTQAAQNPAQLFNEAFAETLAGTLTETLGRDWHVRVHEEPDLSARHNDAIHYRVSITGAIAGDCILEVYESQISTLFPESHASGDAVGRRSKQSFGELLASAVPGLIATSSAICGPISASVQRTPGVEFGGMFVLALAATDGLGAKLQMLLCLDNRLMAAFSAISAGESPAIKGIQIDPANFKLAMDVELNVSLRFGQRQMPLRDVLELTNGAVIELDRHVDDPVELLLDGRVIARGEAVIVDGNYGLRVTEIPQPMSSPLSK
jgi:flagellar motor switch protein FliN